MHDTEGNSDLLIQVVYVTAHNGFATRGAVLDGLSDEEFSRMRTNNVSNTLFECAVCRQSVFIASSPSGRRHFKHYPQHDPCPLSRETYADSSEIYSGEQERHAFLKMTLAQYLLATPEVSEVHVERGIRSEQGRFVPDVNCRLRLQDGRTIRVGFEVQLAWLSPQEIVDRSQRYENSDTHLLWLFAEESSQITQRDVRFDASSPHGNVFFFDDTAISESKAAGSLRLRVDVPRYIPKLSVALPQVERTSSVRTVSLEHIQFPDRAAVGAPFVDDMSGSWLDANRTVVQHLCSHPTAVDAVEGYAGSLHLNPYEFKIFQLIGSLCLGRPMRGRRISLVQIVSDVLNASERRLYERIYPLLLHAVAEYRPDLVRTSGPLEQLVCEWVEAEINVEWELGQFPAWVRISKYFPELEESLAAGGTSDVVRHLHHLMRDG